jgi:hypothetical protein
MLLSICFRFTAGEAPAVVVKVSGDDEAAAWEDGPGASVGGEVDGLR